MLRYEQNVQVSDTTMLKKEQKARTQKIINF